MLVNPPHAFEVAHIVGILAAQVPGMLGLNLAVGLFFFPRLLQRPQLILGQDQTILRHFGIDGLFAATIGGDFGLAPKPAPAPLFAALGPLGVAPKDAIMVGDSATDVAAARAAGIPVVAVGGGYTDKPADELGADKALASLHGLGDLLDAWA